MVIPEWRWTQNRFFIISPVIIREYIPSLPLPAAAPISEAPSTTPFSPFYYIVCLHYLHRSNVSGSIRSVTTVKIVLNKSAVPPAQSWANNAILSASTLLINISSEQRMWGKLCNHWEICQHSCGTGAIKLALPYANAERGQKSGCLHPI